MDGMDQTPIVSGASDSENLGRPDELISRVYSELRSLAEHRLRSQGPGASLQPTELIHEVFVKLVKNPTRPWQGQSHFMGAAAIAMRHILVDRARRANAAKRGGESERVDLDQAEMAINRSPEEVLGIDQALTRLESVDQRSATVVTMRFYLGLGFSEIALALGVTERTVERDWAFARRWLAQELRSGGEAR